MSITTHDGTNGNGLFDVLGVAFNAAKALNTARGSTVPTAGLAILSQFAKVTPTPLNADNVQGLGDSLASWQAGGGSFASQIQTASRNILVSFVQADTTTVTPNNLAANLQYLITQMQSNATTGGSYVSANTPGSSGTPIPGDNGGDLAIILDTIQGNGQAGQNVLAETINFSITSTEATTSPSIVANSPTLNSNRMDYAWPAGSGLSGFSIRLTDPASSLLTNGQFETDSIANIPDLWIPAVATPGTSLLVTSPCVQTITIAGSPTGGSYILTWSDGTNTHATTPVAWNANAATVQTALQAISALSGVTVTSTGTSPNFTFSITFNGIGGAIANLGYVSFLTGGIPTITQAVTTAANSLAYSGHSLIFAANSGEQTTLYQALPTLTPNMVYFLHFRLLQDGMTTGTASATFTASIVAGIGGSPVVDAQGNSGSAIVTVSGAGAITSDQWGGHHFSFRVAPGTSQPCYLKITTSGLPSGGKVYLDDFALMAAQQLYSGGPFIAAVKGRTASSTTDTWSYATTNTWSMCGGGFQTWFNRVFGMADLGLLLPTDVAGGTLIDDMPLVVILM